MSRKKVGELNDTHTVRQACDFYMNTPAFLAVSGNTQKQYEANLKYACDTKVQNGAYLGNIKLKDVRHKHLTVAYDTWVTERGIRSANYISSCISIVFNTSIRHEAMLANYMALVKKRKPKGRKTRWTPAQVKTFLDTAYSQWEWRSIGLIVHMSYEWGQRLGDMRTLTWDEIDFDAQRLDLTQSKRGAEVHLPIGDSLMRMLEQQKKDFGFQEYVAPRVTARAGAYTPYSLEEISKIVNEIKSEANLPEDLWGMDMRRTAITEMLEAGVDMAGIMQVSGHQSPKSVTPYMVNTYKGASTALNKRWSNQDER